MKKNFEINLEIYSKDSIKEWILDFSEVWEITLKDTTLIVSWDTEVEIEEIFNELMNYILSL